MNSKVSALIAVIILAVLWITWKYIKAQIKSGNLAKIKVKLLEFEKKTKAIDDENDNAPLSDLVARNNKRNRKRRGRR